MFDIDKYLEANEEFLGGSNLPQEGGAAPTPWSLDGTMYHFGHEDRRLHLNKGLAQVQGPCCDIGWYFQPTNGPYKILGIDPMRMVSEGGLMLATSYDTSAVIEVLQSQQYLQINTSYPRLK